MSFIFAALVELPAAVVPVIINVVGRRWSLFSLFLLAGAACITYSIVPPGKHWILYLVKFYYHPCYNLFDVQLNRRSTYFRDVNIDRINREILRYWSVFCMLAIRLWTISNIYKRSRTVCLWNLWWNWFVTLTLDCLPGTCCYFIYILFYNNLEFSIKLSSYSHGQTHISILRQNMETLFHCWYLVEWVSSGRC